MQNFLADKLQGAIVTWLQALATQAFAYLGWGGIAAIIAGCFLLFALASRLAKLFTHPATLLVAGCVLVFGLVIWKGSGEPGEAPDDASVASLEGEPKMAEAQRSQPPRDEAVMPDGVNAFNGTDASLLPTPVLPGAYAPGALPPLVTPGFIAHPPAPATHHAVPPAHAAAHSSPAPMVHALPSGSAAAAHPAPAAPHAAAVTAGHSHSAAANAPATATNHHTPAHTPDGPVVHLPPTVKTPAPPPAAHHTPAHTPDGPVVHLPPTVKNPAPSPALPHPVDHAPPTGQGTGMASSSGAHKPDAPTIHQTPSPASVSTGVLRLQPSPIEAPAQAPPATPGHQAAAHTATSPATPKTEPPHESGSGGGLGTLRLRLGAAALGATMRAFSSDAPASAPGDHAGSHGSVSHSPSHANSSDAYSPPTPVVAGHGAFTGGYHDTTPTVSHQAAKPPTYSGYGGSGGLGSGHGSTTPIYSQPAASHTATASSHYGLGASHSATAPLTDPVYSGSPSISHHAMTPSAHAAAALAGIDAGNSYLAPSYPAMHEDHQDLAAQRRILAQQRYRAEVHAANQMFDNDPSFNPWHMGGQMAMPQMGGGDHPALQHGMGHAGGMSHHGGHH